MNIQIKVNQTTYNFVTRELTITNLLSFAVLPCVNDYDGIARTYNTTNMFRVPVSQR